MYKDRIDAANQLAKTLVNKGLDPTKLVVLSIPRGGAVIGDILASKLNCQHQIIISKKLGAPNQPELAIGAITEDGEPSLNNGLIDSLNINNYYLDQEISQVRQKIAEYQVKFRNNKPLEINASTIILTDDGLVTGETIKSCLYWLKQKFKTKKPKPKTILAIPVSSKASAKETKALVDEFICPRVSDNFYALSQYYRSFNQVLDEQVVRLIDKKSVV